ncbi:MAG: rhomboid family intramembrane serine protease, partial [Sulfolobales archaeon]
GAISTLLGMYLVFFPENRVVFLEKEIPAWLFLIAWFAGQLSMLFTEGLGIAVMAHIMGFIFGVIVAGAEKHAESLQMGQAETV